MTDGDRQYAVEIEPVAWNVLMTMPDRIQEQILTAIEGLESQPRPQNAKRLTGKWRGFYRIRSGNYRVIYTIENERLVVVVIKIGDRRDVYE